MYKKIDGKFTKMEQQKKQPSDDMKNIKRIEELEGIVKEMKNYIAELEKALAEAQKPKK